MGFTAALIIGVPIGRTVSEAFGWKVVFAGIAAIGIIAMLIIRFALPEIKGDKPVPLIQQFSLLKKRKVAVGLVRFWLVPFSVFTERHSYRQRNTEYIAAYFRCCKSCRF